jgi:hypothetical protein
MNSSDWSNIWLGLFFRFGCDPGDGPGKFGLGDVAFRFGIRGMLFWRFQGELTLCLIRRQR